MIELSSNISDYIRSVFGNEYLDNFKRHIESEPQTYIRIPGSSPQREEIINELNAYGIVLENNESLSSAFKVLSGYEKTGKTLGYTLGKYYIQSLSSMIPPLVLNPSAGDIVLDMCAAPGSKSTQLSELMQNRGTLYANEPSNARIRSLIFNLDRMNILNMGVTEWRGELLSKIFSNYFDKILVDAPCSGLGIIQKKGEVSNWWSEKSVDRISETQMRLLISAVKAAKPGGEIVYSTCTLTVEENELVLNKILKSYPVELVEIKPLLKSHPALTIYENEKLSHSIAMAHRIIPWEVESEGFFVAKLRKKDFTENSDPAKIKNRGIELLSADDKKVKGYLNSLSDRYGISQEVFQQYRYIVKKNDLMFINADWRTKLPDLFTRIGTKFGMIDNRNNCVLHTLGAQVMGKYAAKNIFELTDIKELEIYLGGGAIKKHTGITGQVIIKFKNYFAGTAVGSKEGLKSQFPRAMRTHTILLS